MNNEIFNQTVGAIICHLSNRITGGFTTEMKPRFLTIDFQYKHKAYFILIHGEADDFAVSINCKKLGTCLDIDNVLSNLNIYLG